MMFGRILAWGSPITNVTGGKRENAERKRSPNPDFSHTIRTYGPTRIDYRFASHVNVVASKELTFVIRTLLSFLAFDASSRKSVKLYMVVKARYSYIYVSSFAARTMRVYMLPLNFSDSKQEREAGKRSRKERKRERRGCKHKLLTR